MSYKPKWYGKSITVRKPAVRVIMQNRKKTHMVEHGYTTLSAYRTEDDVVWACVVDGDDHNGGKQIVRHCSRCNDNCQHDVLDAHPFWREVSDTDLVVEIGQYLSTSGVDDKNQRMTKKQRVEAREVRQINAIEHFDSRLSKMHFMTNPADPTTQFRTRYPIIGPGVPVFHIERHRNHLQNAIDEYEEALDHMDIKHVYIDFYQTAVNFEEGDIAIGVIHNSLTQSLQHKCPSLCVVQTVKALLEHQRKGMETHASQKLEFEEIGEIGHFIYDVFKAVSKLSQKEREEEGLFRAILKGHQAKG